MRSKSTSITVLVTAAVCTWLPAQTNYHKVSRSSDSTNGSAAYPFPGLAGAFRQQILVSGSRLTGLSSKKIKGLWIRRDLGHKDVLGGGSADLDIQFSTARKAPGLASEVFGDNAGTQPTRVFSGRVKVPDSPKLGSSPVPWSATNAVRIVFTTPFEYKGGDLCIDIAGRPVKGAEPDFWLIDYETGAFRGTATPIGKSCSTLADQFGNAADANTSQLQIGSTLSLTAVGKRGATPLMILGAQPIPGGADLSAMGATNCRLYVDQLLITPLDYTVHPNPILPAITAFETQIPPSKSLLGATLFFQFADDESKLALKDRTNAAGLTTSNALQVQVSLRAPDLGLAIVTSSEVDPAATMPNRGAVNGRLGPVLRLLY